MKTIMMLLTVLACVVAHDVCSQTIYGSAIAETTITGLQYGGAIGYRSKKGFMAGAFYQRGRSRAETWPSVQTEFYGAESLIVLARSKKMVFAAHLRGGLSNKMFFVIVPGAQTIIQINKNMSVGTGMAWRFGHAAIDARILFSL